MSWDVAFYGDLSFPSAEAITRWRAADLDPAPESPFRRTTISGSVDHILKPLAGGRLDWLETIVDGNTVSIQGELTRDMFNQEAPAVVAALRTAWDVGGRGEVWIVGLGTEPSYLLRLDAARSLERASPDSSDSRLAAVIAEAGRRAKLPPPPAPTVAAELKTLSTSKSAAHAIAILNDTPMGGFWEEVRVVAPQLPELHARFGREVVPVLVALMVRLEWFADDGVVKILCAVETPEATELLAEMLALPLCMAERTTWLLAHPDLALPALRRVADWPDTERGRFAGRTGPIAPMNELARRLIAELSGMEVAAADTLPAPLQGKRRGSTPKWFHPVAFARPRLVSGVPLSTDAAKRLVVLLTSLKDGDASAFDSVLPAVDRRSLDTLLLELFHVWCVTGAGKAARHFGEAIRALGGEHARERLAELASEPTTEGRQARALLDR